MQQLIITSSSDVYDAHSIPYLQQLCVLLFLLNAEIGAGLPL